MRTAYLLVSHGSTDPRHQLALARLARGVRQHLGRLCRSQDMPFNLPMQNFEHSVDRLLETTSALSAGIPRWARCQPQGDYSDLPIVGTATLEAAALSLAEQLVNFARTVINQDVQQIVVVPLFLLAGVHVKEDLPAELASAQPQLPAGLQIKCLSHLGSQETFKQFVATRLNRTRADRCVLLAHGSRRAKGNQAMQQLGRRSNCHVAFWAVAPDLESQVAELMQQGCQHIAIAPFFLFPGSITDAIIRRTEQLAEHLPKLSLRLLSPIGLSSDLSKVVADIAIAATSQPLVTRYPLTQAVAKNSISA
ncbi:MAG: sirohydrochlorin chelatase [Leptolyngbyaceae cyanobacterium]